MTKPLHAGNASRAGAFAALAADAGLTSVSGALDGDLGFALTLGSSEENYTGLVTRDAGQWELDQDEAWGLKAYPVCGEATAIVDALLAARANTEPNAIKSIVIYTGPRAKQILRYPQPTDLEQARFSMPFIAAIALADGEVSLRTMTEERLSDPFLCELADRVKHVVVSDTHLGGYGANVQLWTADGYCTVGEAVTPRGWGSRRLSTQERREKFVDCTAGSLGESTALELFARLGNIAELKLVAELW